MKLRRTLILLTALVIFSVAVVVPARAVRLEDGSVPTATPQTGYIAPSARSTSSVYSATDKITDFDSNIFITRAGTAQITETITYSNAAAHHGLERFAPVMLADDATNQIYYSRFKLVSVKDEAGRDYQVSRHDNLVAVGLRIGDPDKTFTGAATYIIKYELSPVISKQDGFDFLNLNITGNDWRVPILRATARITIEGEPRWSEVKCFVGKVGSKEACLAVQDGNSYKFTSTRPIAQGEGMTVNGKLPPDYFASYIKPSPIPPFWWLWQWVIGWVAAVVIIMLAAIIRVFKHLAFWRAKKNQTVIAQYESPDGLKPAEIGLLDDNSSGMVEITATLIDLAIRQHIRIDQISPKSFFAGPKYLLTRLTPSKAGLEDYEILLLDAIFAGAGQNEHHEPAIELGKLNQLQMSQTVEEVKSIVNGRLEAKGFYPDHTKNKASSAKHFWQKNSVFKIISPIVIIMLASTIYFAIKSSGQAAPFIATAVALVIAYFIANFRRPTASGVQEWAKVEGFKLFLTVTEKDRLKFSDAPAKNPQLFSKMLPYAVALRVEKEWAKQFEGMDMKNEMYWYSSTDGSFTPTMFVAGISSMTGQFSSSVSSGFSASSGGGGAGGGVGGGGGGGW